MTPTITCPRCGRTSAHPRDVEEGYCGNCHDWTSAPLSERLLEMAADTGFDLTHVRRALRDVDEDR